jgi:hypothetical protein
LAAADLLGVGWPKQFGGQGYSAIEQYIFFEEAKRVNAPIPLVTLNTVGPTLMAFGTEDQKQRFLPAILAGELEFAIGYSEPDAGSDLASVRTTATRDGDEYVINGAKMFTSGAGPTAKKHKGLSLLIVPTDASGFSWQPLNTMLYDHFTPFVFSQLEELGFCGRGEAKDFATIENLSLGGTLPNNSNGGLLGEAYLHGMNGITEGVRQVRGTSFNRVDDVEHVLVTSGTGVPTSALISGRP